MDFILKDESLSRNSTPLDNFVTLDLCASKYATPTTQHDEIQFSANLLLELDGLVMG
jgi:hypothetical protein